MLLYAGGAALVVALAIATTPPAEGGRSPARFWLAVGLKTAAVLVLVATAARLL